MPKRNTQQKFKGQGFEKPKDWFGGSQLKSHPKTRRPLDSKLPLHLVLRSQYKGSLSMRHPRSFKMVNDLVRGIARKFGVRVYEYGNAGNHLHLLIRSPHPAVWARFIRELTGRISQSVQGLKGRKKGVKFWGGRPFTRVVRGWNKAYRLVKDYVLLNHLEGEGIIGFKGAARVVDLGTMRNLNARESRLIFSG